MSAIDNLLSPLQQWLDTLEQRERRIVVSGGIALVVILFYLTIWEPIVANYEQQQQTNKSQRQFYSWIKSSATEIRALNSSGGNTAAKFRNQSISSLADRSAVATGVKAFIDKIEQSKTGVKVNLNSADFDRIVAWLTDLEIKYGITASKVKIEKSKVSGAVNASITLERSS